ncbi:MAG TPA: class I SAM-dependent methyltransferase [Solirubrobacteraceae bacterium]|nr:class I SAM-dependent methyltransferase [Solirubrobacteraceae bacterium]
MGPGKMRAFWDDRARENAAYFVDNQLAYDDPDMAAFWAGGAETVDLILERVAAPAIGPEDVVVEIGCGLGRLTRPLATRAARVRAVDVSAEMLARAREANPQLTNVEWLLGDGVSLAGIDAASADVVFSHVVFQHIPDPAITLGYVREMGRVLRAGGWAAFQVSDDPAVHRAPAGGARLRRRLTALAGRSPRGQDHPAWLGSAVDLGELRAAAEGAGLAVERIADAGTQFCCVLLRRR